MLPIKNMLRASWVSEKKRGRNEISICFIPLLCFFLLHIFLILIFRRSRTNLADIYTEEDYGEQKWESPEPSWSVTCDRSHFEYDLCYINRGFVFDPKTSTISSVDPTDHTPQLEEKIKPYPRKWQHNAMETVKVVTLTTSPRNLPCTIAHGTPALVFSAGGFTKNIFHDFNEGFIPLYITIDTLFTEQDVILAVVDGKDWWFEKYARILSRLSSHPVINLDRETATHCFPSAIVGLMSHGPVNVDPTLQRGPNPKSILDFQAMITSSYKHIHTYPLAPPYRPRLVLMGRTNPRAILNQNKVVEVAKIIGFDVVVFEPNRDTSVEEVYRVIHDCHALIGVHGAGLTNELFLRNGAVFMQIVPIRCSWLGDICYGKLAKRLKLEYFTYDIEVEESSLAGKYPRDMLDDDKGTMIMNDWAHWDIYMSQNVTINLDRFERYLERVYEKAKVFMEKESLKNRFLP